MSEPKVSEKSRRKRATLMMFVVITLALVLQTAILNKLNQISSFRTTNLIFNQVVDILKRNEKTDISSIISDIPIYGGILIYIADS